MSGKKAQEATLSKRAGTREAIEALGFTPLMETAQVVDNIHLDMTGFVRPDVLRESPTA
jgi:hypothetical protein